jgi:Fe-S-cluster-containing dehydrogenase component/DMSO reductase anchor subunit
VTLLSSVAPVDDTPIDVYLARANLSAVDVFAKRHEAELEPRQARYYQELIPVGPPKAGQQLGFEVDLDGCTGCKACVAACHSLNGLDDGESWRTVSLLRSRDASGQPFQQTVTAGCHHCVDPACLSGCPVDAYEKDPITGIVVHLDDQCIGCSYCTLTCPYEVPRFNHRQGIVRKCDMCRGRLAAGEAPACVQACPNDAIRISIVDVATAVAAAGAGARLVPGVAPSSITAPTTVYRSASGRIPEQPALAGTPAGPAHGHPPLAVMLVLTQLSVGAFVLGLLLRSFDQVAGGSRPQLSAAVAVGSGVLALVASVFHLGRPRYAYRAVIGLRHSWLSREVVAFGAFTGLAAAYAGGVAWGRPIIASAVLGAVGWLAATSGLTGLACSVLIYSTTHRSSWPTRAVSAKFGLTAAICGAVAVAWVELLAGSAVTARSLLLTVAALTTAKLAGELSVLRHRRRTSDAEADGWRRAGLLTGELRTTAARRLILGVVGGIGLPLLCVTIAGHGGRGVVAVAMATAALLCTVAGELLERLLFFTTASAPR